jgi:hypothetical protein
MSEIEFTTENLFKKCKGHYSFHFKFALQNHVHRMAINQ